MKTQNYLSAFVAIGVASALHAQIQPIPNVSTGADGPFDPPEGVITTLVARRFDFTTITIRGQATVQFTQNSSNSPVFLLSQGDVTILGTIDISGENGDTVRGGHGGPGGFDGGAPGIGGGNPGDGIGPGAGKGGTPDGLINGGDAAYGTAPTALDPRDGTTYGTQLLIPLIGGSGGGGSAANNALGGAVGGGGGGGAILIASSTRITHDGTIRAWGGYSGNRGSGSGGAVRLLAPVIDGVGNLQVWGYNPSEGHGRVRCDMVDRSNFHVTVQPANAPQTMDQFLPLIFPPNLPTLRVISIAGQPVPANAPSGHTVTFPLNASPSQPIVVEASGFGVLVPIAVQLTPLSGNAPAAIPADILNDPAHDPAQLTVIGSFPPNVPVIVNVWTR